MKNARLTHTFNALLCFVYGLTFSSFVFEGAEKAFRGVLERTENKRVSATINKFQFRGFSHYYKNGLVLQRDLATQRDPRAHVIRMNFLTW